MTWASCTGASACRLGLNHHLSLDNEIDLVRVPDLHAAIYERDSALGLDAQPLRFQLEHQAAPIDGFEQSRTEYPVDGDPGANDLLGKGIEPRWIFEHAARACNSNAASESQPTRVSLRASRRCCDLQADSRWQILRWPRRRVARDESDRKASAQAGGPSLRRCSQRKRNTETGGTEIGPEGETAGPAIAAFHAAGGALIFQPSGGEYPGRTTRLTPSLREARSSSPSSSGHQT
jgi:hypothetical protein